MVAEALFLLPCMGRQAPPTTTSGHIKSKEAFVFQNYCLTHPYNYGPLLSLLGFSRRSAISRSSLLVEVDQAVKRGYARSGITCQLKCLQRRYLKAIPPQDYEARL